MDIVTGLRKFEVVLQRENKTFSPGETVDGNVIIELNRPKTIRGLIVKYEGFGKTTLTSNKIQYKGTENYFEEECYVLGENDGENVEIASGYHEFPFEFTLPNDIPNSFETRNGTIRYTITAIIDRPWKFNHKTSLRLMVESSYDCRQISTSMDAINTEEYHSFCCFPFCYNMGSLTVNISIPKSGYNVGETIEAQVDIDNKSTTIDITHVELRLKRHLRIIASEKTLNTRKTVKYEQRRGPFDKKDKVTVQMKIPDIPSVLPSTFPNTELFNVKYTLIVRVFPAGCHVRFEKIYPVVIGRLPRSSCPLNVQTVPSESEDTRLQLRRTDIVHPIPVEVTDLLSNFLISGNRRTETELLPNFLGRGNRCSLVIRSPSPGESIAPPSTSPPPSYYDCMKNDTKT